MKLNRKKPNRKLRSRRTSRARLELIVELRKKGFSWDEIQSRIRSVKSFKTISAKACERLYNKREFLLRSDVLPIDSNRLPKGKYKYNFKDPIKTKTNARQWFDHSKANQFPVIVTYEP